VGEHSLKACLDGILHKIDSLAIIHPEKFDEMVFKNVDSPSITSLSLVDCKLTNDIIKNLEFISKCKSLQELCLGIFTQ
jgi:hypothetical protein